MKGPPGETPRARPLIYTTGETRKNEPLIYKLAEDGPLTNASGRAFLDRHCRRKLRPPQEWYFVEQQETKLREECQILDKLPALDPTEPTKLTFTACISLSVPNIPMPNWILKLKHREFL